MITHVVTFKLADAGPDHLEHCRQMVEALAGRVPSLRALTVGTNLVESPRAHDLALIATFDDLEGLAAYRDHPAHVPVARYLREAAEAVAVVDFAGGAA